MENKQYKVILEEVRQIKQQVDDIDDGLMKDRERMQNFAIELEGVKNEIAELRRAVNRNSEDVKNKVHDVVKPLVKSTSGLTQEVSNAVKKNGMFVWKQEAESFIDQIKSLWRK